MQQAHNDTWERQNETSYWSRIGAYPQAAGSAHNSDETTLLMREAGGADYASGLFAAGGNSELDSTIPRTLVAQKVPATLLRTDVSHRSSKRSGAVAWINEIEDAKRLAEIEVTSSTST